MLYYFRLQNKLFQKTITEGGVNLIFGYLVLLLIFIGGSTLCFIVSPKAEYAYPFIGLFIASKLSEYERNMFLKRCFSKLDYIKVRIIENLIIVAPFAIFLIFKLLFLPTAVLVGLSVLLALIPLRSIASLTIPTPFNRQPFEFCVGFRSTFIIVAISYFMTIMAIIHDNFNLGFVALIMLYLSLLFYYLQREQHYYIWIFSMSPKQFLFSKIKTALFHSSLIASPVVLALSIHTPGRIVWLLLAMVLGSIYLITMILAKYSYLSEEVEISTLVMGMIIIYVPPLITIPWFYYKSKTNLEKILK